jgi:uncharacterized protein YuzE
VRRPLNISIDTDVPGGAAYVRYSTSKAVRQDALDDDFSVAVDLDSIGEVVGVELTLLDCRAFELFAEAGRKYDLEIPDLRSLGAAS